MTNTTTYQRKAVQQKREEMKVFFEFPEPTENDNKVRQEIKELLTNTLQEQMAKIS